MITKQSIERLVEQTDIVDVVSNYVVLKKSGRNFVGLCPFHDDRNPSMSVSPDKGIYHCFSCKAGGDAITFIMEYEKLSFPEAVERLAAMQNFTLEYSGERAENLPDKRVLEIVGAYYSECLRRNQTALEYLFNRSFDWGLIEKFELGFAPNSQNTLNLLSNEQIDPKDALDVGIIKQGENGLYASFSNRITFAIKNHTGKLIGFGGRTITNHPAKYVNSPDSKVFDKSKTLYAYHLAKDEIYKSKEIIITEGYMDTIMLHKAGYKNAVAVLGTALTEKHLPLLRRSSARVVLCFDGDAAGLNAALKSSKLLMANGIDTSVVIIPDGADPADLVQNGKELELDRILNKRVEAGEFVIRNIIDSFEISRPQQKKAALDEIQKFALSLDEVVAKSYQNLVARALKIPIDSFSLNGKRSNFGNFNSNFQSRNFNQNSNRNFSQNSPKTAPKISENFSPRQKDYLELEILKTILLDKNAFFKVKDSLKKELFKTHLNEYEALMSVVENPSKNPILRELEMDESVSEFGSFEELFEGIKRLVIRGYESELSSLLVSDEPDKIQKIETIQKIIRELKQA